MNFGGTLKVNKFACFTLVFIFFVIIYWRSSSPSYPTDKSDLINLKSILKASIQAAERGGTKVIDGTNKILNVKSKGKTQEDIDDPVTNADYASHCTMYYGLKNTFPKLTLVSEEHVMAETSCTKEEQFDIESSLLDQRVIEYMVDEYVYVKDVTIWIDPLDATKEYTEALYRYVTTMVCVAIKGVPIIGVIHYPFSHRTFWGWFTKRTSNNIPNVVHREENKDQPKVVISRSHPGKVAEMAKKAFGPKATVASAAGAGYKVMGVINGTFDVYFHTTAIKKWDLCAGDAILRTVNGKMTTANGDNIDYSSDSEVKVTGGILATRYDHNYYLGKMKNIVSSVP